MAAHAAGSLWLATALISMFGSLATADNAPSLFRGLRAAPPPPPEEPNSGGSAWALALGVCALLALVLIVVGATGAATPGRSQQRRGAPEPSVWTKLCPCFASPGAQPGQRQQRAIRRRSRALVGKEQPPNGDFDEESEAPNMMGSSPASAGPNQARMMQQGSRMSMTNPIGERPGSGTRVGSANRARTSVSQGFAPVAPARAPVVSNTSVQGMSAKEWIERRRAARVEAARGSLPPGRDPSPSALPPAVASVPQTAVAHVNPVHSARRVPGSPPSAAPPPIVTSPPSHAVVPLASVSGEASLSSAAFAHQHREGSVAGPARKAVGPVRPSADRRVVKKRIGSKAPSGALVGNWTSARDAAAAAAAGGGGPSTAASAAAISAGGRHSPTAAGAFAPGTAGSGPESFSPGRAGGHAPPPPPPPPG